MARNVARDHDHGFCPAAGNGLHVQPLSRSPLGETQLQPCKCGLIEFGCKILLQSNVENLVVGRDAGEQCHRRLKLNIVRRTKNLFDRATFNIDNELGALSYTNARSG